MLGRPEGSTGRRVTWRGHRRRFYVTMVGATLIILAGIGTGSYALARGFGPWTGSWTNLHASGSLPDKWGSSAAYDAKSGKMFESYGSGYAAIPNETWAYDFRAHSFANLLSSGSLPGRVEGGSLVFDESLGKILTVGLKATSSRAHDVPFGETWAYDLQENGWSNLQPTNVPPYLPDAQLVYDTALGSVVLFDPGRSEQPMWSYDSRANTWNELQLAVKPPDRLGTAIVCDRASGKLILFGGSGSTADGSGALNDTWAYDAESNAWTEMRPATAPSARAWASMVYDENSGKVILFGGNAHDQVLGDTWAYDYQSNTWTELHPADSPAARMNAFMFCDTASHEVVLVGGFGMDKVFNDVWAFSVEATN